MNDQREQPITLISGDAVLIICITVLVILCIGEPDLLDAIISRVGGAA